MVVNGETDKILGVVVRVSFRKTHFSSSFPGFLIVHSLSVSSPFNFPNGNLKQQWSHIGVFICYKNIDAKKIIILHIHGINLLNPYKTAVSHLNLPAILEDQQNLEMSSPPSYYREDFGYHE